MVILFNDPALALYDCRDRFTKLGPSILEQSHSRTILSEEQLANQLVPAIETNLFEKKKKGGK